MTRRESSRHVDFVCLGMRTPLLDSKLLLLLLAVVLLVLLLIQSGADH